MSKPKISTENVIILLCCAIYFVSYFCRLDFNAVMAEIIDSGTLNKEQAGMIGTALFMAYGVGQLLSGYLGDKIKPVHIICCGLALSTLCNILMPLFHSVAALIVIWGVNGLAQAMLWPPIVKIMSEQLSKEKYTKGVFWVTTAAQISTICIYLIVPLLISISGWRSVFFCAAGLAVVVLVLFFLCISRITKKMSDLSNENTLSSNTNLVVSESIKKAFISSGLIFILFAIILQGILRDGLTSWMPTYMTEIFVMSTTLSIFLNVLIPVFSWVCILVAGILFRKVFKSEVIQAMFFFGVALLFAVVFLLGRNIPAVAITSAALITGCMHGVNITLISYVPLRFKITGKVALVSGVTNAFTYIGSTISSYGFAAISVSFGWEVLVYIWIGTSLLGVLFLLCDIKRWNKFISE